MVFTKENFEENRCMSFVMVKKNNRKPDLFVNDAGYLTSGISRVMEHYEINFGLDKSKYEYHDFGYMLVRFGRVTVFNNLKYSRSDRAATLNCLKNIDDRAQIFSRDILVKSNELVESSKKYKNKSDDKYDAVSLRNLNKEILLDYQGGYCWDCGKRYDKLELHYKVPRSLGGSDDIANLVLLCGKESGSRIRVSCDCHKNWDDLALGGGHIIFPGFSMDLLPSFYLREDIPKKKKLKLESGNTRNRKYRNVSGRLAFNNRISCRSAK